MTGNVEDLLAEALRYSTLGGKMPVNKLLATLIRSVELNALTQVRDQLNKRIHELAKQGIDIGDQNMNPFHILGVSPTATEPEVKAAYKKAAAKAHPDRGGSNEHMVKVNAAYEAIRRFRQWN